MSMALKEIKNRIRAANNIRQITKAMKLIASIKLKKIQRTFFPFRIYLNSIREIMNVLMNNIDFKLMVSGIEYFKIRNTSNILAVVISSDKGLCGSYNTNLFNFFEKKYTKHNLKMITVGRKAYLYFSKRNYEIIDHFDKVPDVPSFSFSKKINQSIMENYKNLHDISKVDVIYTKFINSIRYQPNVETVLPISSVDVEKINKTVDHFIFEPSLESIGQYIFELYIDSLIYKLLVESKLSEFSARFSAMNTATDNAEKLIKELKLLFFKKRQESITKELLEISAGVEALK
ncbi:MAG: ATP synthase F1 subunit gamma [Candidatus Calescibacterium sp.]|nr:ATP synthase F1 subunit gamma [Candidatus Calescibacterium sp.]MDW8132519.1 ATP synthase F1 subunit gamma [Candidatus Calescibacterium sp.]